MTGLIAHPTSLSLVFGIFLRQLDIASKVRYAQDTKGERGLIGMVAAYDGSFEVSLPVDIARYRSLILAGTLALE